MDASANCCTLAGSGERAAGRPALLVLGNEQTGTGDPGPRRGGCEASASASTLKQWIRCLVAPSQWEAEASLAVKTSDLSTHAA